MKTVEKTSRRKNHRRKKRRWGKLLLAAVLFLVAGGSLIFARSHWTEIQAQLDILPDANAKKGSLYGESPRELDAGNFWVLVNQLPTLEEGSQTCNIRYENPSSNHYSARVSLYLMESGELLGHTRRVDPGTYVETIRIRKALPAGEYPVRAVLELFEDKKPAGDMSLEMILRVVEKMADPTETENQLETGDQPKKEDHLEKKDQSKKEGHPGKGEQPKKEEKLEQEVQPKKEEKLEQEVQSKKEEKLEQEVQPKKEEKLEQEDQSKKEDQNKESETG